jgi:hypothetical protein
MDDFDLVANFPQPMQEQAKALIDTMPVPCRVGLTQGSYDDRTHDSSPSL